MEKRKNTQSIFFGGGVFRAAFRCLLDDDRPRCEFHVINSPNQIVDRKIKRSPSGEHVYGEYLESKLLQRNWQNNFGHKMSSKKMHVLIEDYSVACCDNLLAIPDYSASHIEWRHKKTSLLPHSRTHSPCVDDDKPKVVWKLLIALGESFSFFVAFLSYFSVHVKRDVRVRTETWILFFYFLFVQSVLAFDCVLVYWEIPYGRRPERS